MNKVALVAVAAIILLSVGVADWAVHADWRSQTYDGTITKTTGYFYLLGAKPAQPWYSSTSTISLSNGTSVVIGATNYGYFNLYHTGEKVCATHSNAVGWSFNQGACN